MSRIENSLTQWESRLRKIIEGNRDGDGISRKFQHQVVKELTKALQLSMKKADGANDSLQNRMIAPERYTLVLPSEEAQVLLNHPSILNRLVKKLEAVAAERGYGFIAPPLIKVVADPEANAIKAFAEGEADFPGNSSTTELDEIRGVLNLDATITKQNAFLIVNGLSTFCLEQAVINIGRDPSNDLCLDDLRISRKHAQIRQAQGRWVIFDLDSKWGTIVNGRPVTNRVLHQGDVIQLGGVPLVFGLEDATPTNYTQELPSVPPRPEVL